MHSTIVAILATTAGFAAATPLSFAKQAECPSSAKNTAYYVCGNNGFRGYCSVDPCAKPWCPDFKLKTCDPFVKYPNVTVPAANCSTTATTTPVQSGTTTTIIQTETTTTTFCSSSTTPPATCSSSTTPIACSSTQTSTTCSESTTPTPAPPPCTGTGGCKKQPIVKKPCTGAGAFYVCANNGFRGNCSVDPCALAWCPDYKPYMCEAVAACDCGAKETKPDAGKNKSSGSERRQDNNGVCPEGTGYFQVCGNGFRGCCKADACGQASPICPNSAW
jgi:hypothetical protein